MMQRLGSPRQYCWCTDATGPIMVNGGCDVSGTERLTPAPHVLREIQELVAKAKNGDQQVVPRLRQLLDAHPCIWQHCGDLAAQAEMAWIALIAGPDLYLRECLLRQTTSLREELAGGASPSPIEGLLV